MKKFLFVFFGLLLMSNFVYSQNSLAVNASIQDYISAAFPESAFVDFGTIDGSTTGAKTSGNATLTIISNKPHWKVTFTSGHDSTLVSGSTTATAIPYKLKASLSTASSSVWSLSKLTTSMEAYQTIPTGGLKLEVATGNGKTPVGGITFDVGAELTMPTSGELYEAGTTFTDTVTITIISLL
ncbi:MAG: hypothetical protein AB1407_00235 [Spirochaetota bacterium]